MVQSNRAARVERRIDKRATRDRRRAAARSVREGGRAIKSADERRRDILDAALKLFASRGYADTTVSDIAAEAGMATGTVYLYFPSKEDVLEGLHTQFREQNLAAISEVAVDAMERTAAGEQVDYTQTIDAILDAIAAIFVANRDLVVVCTKYRPEEFYEQTGTEHHGGHIHPAAWALQEGVRLRLIHTSDPEMTAYLFDAALAYNLHTHITFGDPPDLGRIMAAAKEMMHKTLALPQGPTPSKARDGARRGAGSRRRSSPR